MRESSFEDKDNTEDLMARPAALGSVAVSVRASMTTAITTAIVLWLAGCATAPASQPVVAEEVPPAPSAETVALVASIAEAPRSERDHGRDAGRRPAEVLNFLGISPGMTGIDLIAAGGWYTEVLAWAVGPSGKVYSQNPPIVLKFRDGANDKELSQRIANNRLPQVERLDLPLEEVELPDASLDFALTALNLHDVYNNNPDTALAMLRRVHGLLKDDGVFGIIDHRGNAGLDNTALHRMQEADAVALAQEAGFEVETSDILANGEDDRTKGVFDPSLGRNTDRFLLKLTKK